MQLVQRHLFAREQFRVKHLAINVDDQRLDLWDGILLHHGGIDDLGDPAPVGMGAQHANRVTLGIADRCGEIDKAQWLTVRRSRQQLGEQHRLVGITGVLGTHAGLKPWPLLH